MLGLSSTTGLLSGATATTGVMAVRGGAGGTSPSGPGGMAQELERLQERSDRNASELRRAQAELRLANSERDRLRANADSLQVRYRGMNYVRIDDMCMSPKVVLPMHGSHAHVRVDIL